MGIDPVTHSPRLDLLDLSSIISSSFYNSSQMNMSRFLGVQPLVNPEFLRLATSLMSSQSENENILLQNLQENQLYNPEIQNQIAQLVQTDELQGPVQELPSCTALSTSCVSCPSEAQVVEPNVEQFPSNFTDFSSSNSQLTHEWQSSGLPSNFTEDYVPLPGYSYYGSDQQTLMDPSSETSTFLSNNSNQNFSFASVFSTPSSSPTPLNSNSTHINSGTEDERDSYCSNMLKFEITDILDVNGLIM